jgi:hypothetical protein
MSVDDYHELAWKHKDRFRHKLPHKTEDATTKEDVDGDSVELISDKRTPSGRLNNTRAPSERSVTLEDFTAITPTPTMKTGVPFPIIQHHRGIKQITTEQLKKHRNPAAMVVTDNMSESELKCYTNFLRSKIEAHLFKLDPNLEHEALVEFLLAGFLCRPSKPMSWSPRQLFYVTPRQMELIREQYSPKQTHHWNLSLEALRHAYIQQNNSYSGITLIFEAYQLIRNQLIQADVPHVVKNHDQYMAEDFIDCKLFAQRMRSEFT